MFITSRLVREILARHSPLPFYIVGSSRHTRVEADCFQPGISHSSATVRLAHYLSQDEQAEAKIAKGPAAVHQVAAVIGVHKDIRPRLYFVEYAALRFKWVRACSTSRTKIAVNARLFESIDSCLRAARHLVENDGSPLLLVSHVLCPTLICLYAFESEVRSVDNRLGQRHGIRSWLDSAPVLTNVHFDNNVNIDAVFLCRILQQGNLHGVVHEDAQLCTSLLANLRKSVCLLLICDFIRIEDVLHSPPCHLFYFAHLLAAHSDRPSFSNQLLCNLSTLVGLCVRAEDERGIRLDRRRHGLHVGLHHIQIHAEGGRVHLVQHLSDHSRWRAGDVERSRVLFRLHYG
mmetsp:Transcript_41417/g.107298  ORF Transcript_41417/g.107298 Transcript_41417/m.107298 type:complete len:346 (-) Transcript_41417:150-1187(-)